jgi:hypothetical protein
MKKHREERNWSQYNQKLKAIASIDFFISEEAIAGWHYQGKRSSGGKLIYSDHVIELCLMMKEFYGLAYRQTQGFVASVLSSMKLDLPMPDYTTLSRRAQKLNVTIRKRLHLKSKESLVVAIDSTGLSLFSRTEWNRLKHGKKNLEGHERWRKLHVIINVKTGEILGNSYTSPTVNDGQELPSLLTDIEEDLFAVCGDMAYDTLNCRKAIRERGARQLIPPIRRARLSEKNGNLKQKKDILKERDDAINYINHNTVNGDSSLARKAWKEHTGYHARSLVETTMWQIKSHCSDRLTNKREDTRSTQATIKCKVVNLINAA